MLRDRVQNGEVMFISMNTWHKRQVFIHEKFARMAIETLYEMKKEKPYQLYGFVIMPDHLHLLVKILAPNRVDNFVHTYQTGLSFKLGTGAFFEDYVDLRMPKQPQAKLRYMYDKPFLAELSDTPKEYPWSSASGSWPLDELPFTQKA